jgi:hypothetical protein
MTRPSRVLAALWIAAALLVACDRNLEPFDPAEQPRQPDLSKIFPAGAEGAPTAPEPSLELPPPPAAMQGEPALAAGSGEPIRGTLRIAPELQDVQPRGAVLFLIARTAEAGPPLAVKRIEAPRFPLDFEIGPADRMLASIPFAGSVMITARLDSDGNATSRTPGDLQGIAAQPVSPGASGVEIVLDQKL